MAKEIRIGIVEDHPMIQRCLQNDINAMANCGVDFIVDTFDGLKKNLKECNPQIILLDIILKGEKADGKDIAVFLKENYPEIKTIIVSDYFDDTLINALKVRGVKAYIPKVMAEGSILEKIIREVHDKNDFISIQIEHVEEKTNLFLDNIRISSTKQRILQYVSLGYKQHEIAEIMDLSPKTIHKHLHELRENFDVRSTAELLSKVNKLKFA